MIEVLTAHELSAYIGSWQRCALHRNVERVTVQAFLEISHDTADIHTGSDPIVPGTLLIALLPSMLQSGLVVQQCRQCLTVSYAKVRFLKPVKTTQSLVLDFHLLSVKQRQSHCFVSAELSLKCVVSGQAVLTAIQTDCYQS